MITDYIIAPHARLAHLVEEYVLSTSQGQRVTFLSNWAASPDSSLIFHLADRPQQLTQNAEPLLNQDANFLTGLLNRYNGQVQFQGSYHTFVIRFKSNGLTGLSGIPAREVTNQIIRGEAIWGASINDLQGQLQRAGTIWSMADVADSFLLAWANAATSSPFVYPAITALSHQLVSSRHWLKVDQYADQCNMSLRNFERRFTQQIGVPPKVYIRLVRFNELVRAKLRQPSQSLTQLAHAYGYYDQMHMIKDFKQFSQLSPTEFFLQSADCTELALESARQNSPVGCPPHPASARDRQFGS